MPLIRVFLRRKTSGGKGQKCLFPPVFVQKNIIFVINEKNLIFLEKKLASLAEYQYNNKCCDMIAMKREVAAHCGRFSVERMSS
ncbi:hypothetical protein DXC51_16165 [Eisenbergiella massiliensis]|uniref:Uncharacterized protein n=1 Tax=Eisenbergiella massiliensis TaxID=1720294 RepID=A0A3E3I2T2_9FIRM|nr:hypothetical protein DXC51_16165 [Eisenbergiella massiliensis]